MSYEEKKDNKISWWRLSHLYKVITLSRSRSRKESFGILLRRFSWRSIVSQFFSPLNMPTSMTWMWRLLPKLRNKDHIILPIYLIGQIFGGQYFLVDKTSKFRQLRPPKKILWVSFYISKDTIWGEQNFRHFARFSTLLSADILSLGILVK